MDETTTTGAGQVPADALTERELRVEISRQRQLLSVLDTPELIVAAAERIAACGRELEWRHALRCPACNSPRVYAFDRHGVTECGACGARFGSVSQATYRAHCPGGWSADTGFENARYVDFTVSDDGPHSAARGTRRVHGWINKADGKWVQLG